MEQIISIPSAIEQSISKRLIGRARRNIGGSHTTVTYPPLDALEKIDTADALEAGLSPCDQLNLYFHVAYCEHICPFCHYAKTKSPINADRDDVGAYVGALLSEIKLRGNLLKQSDIGSIYLGGGTPSVLSPHALEKLLDAILASISGKPSQFCVETSPLTMADGQGRNKLDLLLQAGVDRISIGVQSFDDQILKDMRGHDLKRMMDGLSKLFDTSAHINIDMIQDLPNQTWESLRRDLDMIAKLRPHQVTWYIMRPQDNASLYKKMLLGELPGIPSDLDSAVRRYALIKAMRDIGYSLKSGGRFVRDESIVDHYKKIRSGLDATLLGFGVSAYSHGWGWFFKNISDHNVRSGIREYVKRMQTGRSAIDTGMMITDRERQAASRVNGVRSTLAKSLLKGRSADATLARRLVRAFVEAGLMAQSPGGDIHLTDEGRAFEEEISSLFYSRSVIETLNARERYWVDHRYPPLKRLFTQSEKLRLSA